MKEENSMAGINNEMANFTEFRVVKKVEGSYKLLRYGIIAAHVIFFFGCMFGLMALKIGRLNSFAVPAFLVFLPLYGFWLLPKYLWKFTWCYAQVEYEYFIKAGTLNVYTWYGKVKRKHPVRDIQISRMEAIAPCRGEYLNKIADKKSFDHYYVATSSLKHPDNYYMIYQDAEGKRCCLILQATNKAVKIMKFLNRETVEVELSI